MTEEPTAANDQEPFSTVIEWPLLLDVPGLNTIANVLKAGLGELEFRAKGSDGEHHKGTAIEEIIDKAKYGTSHIVELWMLRKGSAWGLYLESHSPQPARLFVPGGELGIGATLLVKAVAAKYVPGYSRFVRSPMLGVLSWFYMAYFIPVSIKSLIRVAQERVGTTSVANLPSAPVAPVPSPSPVAGSEGINWFSILWSIGVVVVVLTALHWMLKPLRPLWNFGFPDLAFDVPANQARNDSAKRMRWVVATSLLGLIITGIMA